MGFPAASSPPSSSASASSMFHSGFSEQDVLMRLPNNETVLYTGHRCSDRAPVVIKAVKAGPDRRVPKKVSREVAALRRCGSTSNVVGFYATTRLSMNDEEFFCIVLAYDWSMVEMFEHVMQRVKSQVAARTWAQVPVLSTRETKAVVAGLADALEWIHSQNIVHGDLKPENVLVNREGEMSRVKVIDFGNAHGLDEPSCGGTHYYRAPECDCCAAAQGHFHSSTAEDIFSLGALLTVVVTGTMPEWDTTGFCGCGETEWTNYPRKDSTLWINGSSPRYITELVHECTRAEPDDRPTAPRVREIAETWKAGELGKRQAMVSPQYRQAAQPGLPFFAAVTPPPASPAARDCCSSNSSGRPSKRMRPA